jgi:hypothetical protein
MKQGDKKVLFGSMVETSSGAQDQGDHFMKNDRMPRSALKAPQAMNKRGLSQAPSAAQKRLHEPEFKKVSSHQSKLVQRRENL